MRSFPRVFRLAAGLSAALLLTACPDKGTSPPVVASVQLSTTYSNPRVGETSNMSARGVTDGGVEVQGVTCTFSSGTPAVASINATTGVLTALSVGTTVITASCGGKTGTMTITVRPKQFTLTINKTGAGLGAVFANPAGTTFDDGTVVAITATANTGSTFTGWGGACTGKTQPCSVTMNADKTVTADFSDGEQFTIAAAFGGGMSSVSDPAPPGCTYGVSVQVTSFDLLFKTTSATGTTASTISVTPTGQSGVGTCTGNPFSVTSTGTLTVGASTITGTLTFFSQSKGKDTQTLTINATRNGSTITGTMSINQKLYNGAGTEFTSTGGTYSFTLNKVP